MDFIKKYGLAIGVILLGIVFIVSLIFAFIKQTQQASDPNAEKSLETTVITSPLSGTQENYTVNYGADINPNQDAVKQRFRLFQTDRLNLQPSIKANLEAFLPGALAREVLPTYAPTYVHIVKDTVRCSGSASCTMDIYIDSPEMLFALTIQDDGYTLVQKPWEGLPQ